MASELLSLHTRNPADLSSASRTPGDGEALDETAVTDVSLTLFVKEDDGATDSVDGSVPFKLEDVGGTGGGGGDEVSIVTSGSDRRTATVEEEGFGATISSDGVVPIKLRHVVVAGGGGDSRRRRSSRCTAPRPPSFCISAGKREKIRSNLWRCAS